MGEEIPKCKACEKPLRWSGLGVECRALKAIEKRKGNYAQPSAKSLRWAEGERLRLTTWRANNKRGFLGEGDFCNQQCAAMFAVVMLRGIREGKYTLVKNRY